MKIAIIGSGFGGLSAAIKLAQQGHQVTIFEKNEQLGGRASVREQDGFRFDMGPSRYLMPDAFQYFFDQIGENIHDHVTLTKLTPSYKIYFTGEESKTIDIYDELERNHESFESLEKGSMNAMRKYLAKAKYQYEIAMKDFIPKNYNSIFDFFNLTTILKGTKLKIFSTMQRYVARFFHTPELQKIVQYPLVFLGTAPKDAPALYNIMSYVDFGLGVRYPQGGINEIVQVLVRIAHKYGVICHTNSEVVKITTQGRKATGIQLSTGEEIAFDTVVSNADMHRTETRLLDSSDQTYNQSYRSTKTMSPSAFIIYLGIKGKVKNLQHHTLIFSQDRDRNFGEIFDEKVAPSDPSLYICCPSQTDPSVAPDGDENLFVLVPFPSGVELSASKKQAYRNKVIELIENTIGDTFQDRIVVERIFDMTDFTSRYNSYQGTALGLAHTFKQTAIFRPHNKSKKLNNLYYTGAYTNPGIGMPMCLISGLLAAQRVNKQ